MISWVKRVGWHKASLYEKVTIEHCSKSVMSRISWRRLKMFRTQSFLKKQLYEALLSVACTLTLFHFTATCISHVRRERKIKWHTNRIFVRTGKRCHWVNACQGPSTFHPHMILSKGRTRSGRERNHLCQAPEATEEKKPQKGEELLSLFSPSHTRIW